MIIEEVYTAILKDDVDKVIEYLNAIPENNTLVRDKLDKLLAYAIAKNREEIVCILLSYNASPQSFSGINYFYAKEFGSIKLKKILDKPSCEEDCED